MDEKKYIKRIKHGDYCALDELIEKLYPQVYEFILYKIKNESDAKDITQEVFIRFIKVIPRYKPQGKIIHNLYKISSHLCINYYTRTVHYQPLEDGQIQSQEDVHTTIINQMTREQIRRAIYKLKPIYQDIIILKYFYQYTFKEISSILSINISTIKTRYYHALIELKHIMEDYDEN